MDTPIHPLPIQAERPRLVFVYYQNPIVNQYYPGQFLNQLRSPVGPQHIIPIRKKLILVLYELLIYLLHYQLQAVSRGPRPKH